MIAIIDYGAGNLASVQNALHTLSYTSYIASHVHEITSNTNIVIMPGVGDGSFMMQELENRGFVDFLQQWHKENKPLLGICVGAQVLLSTTQEGNRSCLNLIEGTCESFEDIFSTDDTVLKAANALKIPHMGWNEVIPQYSSPLYQEIPQHATFYFVHSYFLMPTHNEHIMGITNYGISFSSIVQKGNTFGIQFHPEKSGQWGMQLLKNFILYYQ